MNWSLHRHTAWSLVTIMAFLVGTYWQTESKDISPRDSAPAKKSQSKTHSQSSSIDRSSGTKSNRSANVSTPLSPTQRDLLVQSSIKSSSAIERRLAFDNLLRRIPSLNGAQILALRTSLAKHGASNEQQKLFDYAWTARHPESAIAHLDAIPGEQQPDYLANLLPGLASSDPQAAIDLFTSLEPNVQGQLRRSLYEGLIDHDLEFATNYVFESANPAQPDWRPMDEFTRQLVTEQGVDATLDWATQLPKGPLRGNAWSAAYAKWTTENPITVAESLQEMPISGDRDQAINGFISALAGQDPETAVIWAAEIGQAGLRESAMIRAGTRFFKKDPTAATDWFASSGLPKNALATMNPLE